MVFNSIQYLFFFPVVFTIYWLTNNFKLKVQNIFLLIASYYFYQAWDFRFLFLLIFSTLLDYYSGLKIENSDNAKHKKFWLILSIAVNLGFLGVFKYFNFFSESFELLFSKAGIQLNTWTLDVVLPVGISFYTFHGLSYVIDVYYGRIKVVRNIVDYSLFVSFFPLLVAGPIERATHLLPQIQTKRNFDLGIAADGLRQILWGLFKKMVVADNCATYVNEYFHNPSQTTGDNLLIGSIFFAFQIYGDFSGYSDIASGSSKLLGFKLLNNFSFPYFSRDISEFWRRWHISLSSWFRDYVYIPLGGSRSGKKKAIINTLIIFTLSGFWHGANWTFIMWGLANALLFLPLIMFNLNRLNIKAIGSDNSISIIKELPKVFLTFSLVCLMWILFRAETISQAIEIYCGMFSKETIWAVYWLLRKQPTYFIILLIMVEWINRNGEHGFQIAPKSIIYRWLLYLLILFLIYIFGAHPQEFIYFQF